MGFRLRHGIVLLLLGLQPSILRPEWGLGLVVEPTNSAFLVGGEAYYQGPASSAGNAFRLGAFGLFAQEERPSQGSRTFGFRGGISAMAVHGWDQPRPGFFFVEGVELGWIRDDRIWRTREYHGELTHTIWADFPYGAFTLGPGYAFAGGYEIRIMGAIGTALSQFEGPPFFRGSLNMTKRF